MSHKYPGSETICPLLLRSSKFIMYTDDHAALKSILGTNMTKGRLARCIMPLQEYKPYDNIIHRKKGTPNANTDAFLSQIHSVNAQDYELKDTDLLCFVKYRRLILIFNFSSVMVSANQMSGTTTTVWSAIKNKIVWFSLSARILLSKLFFLCTFQGHRWLF